MYIYSITPVSKWFLYLKSSVSISACISFCIILNDPGVSRVILYAWYAKVRQTHETSYELWFTINISLQQNANHRMKWAHFNAGKFNSCCTQSMLCMILKYVHISHAWLNTEIKKNHWRHLHRGYPHRGYSWVVPSAPYLKYSAFQMMNQGEMWDHKEHKENQTRVFVYLPFHRYSSFMIMSVILKTHTATLLFPYWDRMPFK